jgi:hypothetical protein
MLDLAGPLHPAHFGVVPLYLPLFSVHLRFVFRRGSFHDHVIEVGSPHVIGKLLPQFFLLLRFVLRFLFQLLLYRC